MKYEVNRYSNNMVSSFFYRPFYIPFAFHFILIFLYIQQLFKVGEWSRSRFLIGNRTLTALEKLYCVAEYVRLRGCLGRSTVRKLPPTNPPFSFSYLITHAHTSLHTFTYEDYSWVRRFVTYNASLIDQPDPPWSATESPSHIGSLLPLYTYHLFSFLQTTESDFSLPPKIKCSCSLNYVPYCMPASILSF